MGVDGQRHAPAALPPGKRPGTHCTGGRVGPRSGLDGIRSPDRPARSESLYRLSYTEEMCMLCSVCALAAASRCHVLHGKRVM
jgi:hypothetical protein